MLCTLQNIKAHTHNKTHRPNTILKYRSTECFKYTTMSIYMSICRRAVRSWSEQSAVAALVALNRMATGSDMEWVKSHVWF